MTSNPEPEYNRHPRIIRRPRHIISRKNIDVDALKVLYRLRKFGFKAYLVGGGVRDLLLKRLPKDFDIVTDAHPRKIKKLFRNSFLIGRRFRLAHIKFGEKIIEVSTFRKKCTGNEINKNEDGSGISSENVFGTSYEDAYRRDFTINALFYTTSNFSIIDFTGGYRDLQAGLVRVIGNPRERYEEDPVRMIRAIRVASRVGFAIESNTYRGIVENNHLLSTIPSARLLEEILILLKMGNSRIAVRLLQKSGILGTLIPEVSTLLDTSGRENMELFFNFFTVLDDTTARHGLQSPIILWTTFLVATLHLQFASLQSLFEQGAQFEQTKMEAKEMIDKLGVRFTIPKWQRRRIQSIFQALPTLLSQKSKPAKIRRLADRNFFEEAVIMCNIYSISLDKRPQSRKIWRLVRSKQTRRTSKLRKSKNPPNPIKSGK